MKKEFVTEIASEILESVSTVMDMRNFVTLLHQMETIRDMSSFAIKKLEGMQRYIQEYEDNLKNPV